MRKLWIAGILLFAGMVAQAQSIAVLHAAHKTTFHTSQQTILTHALCSATAVGPHAILTATHCEEGTDDIDLQGIDNTLHIVAKIRDAHDHTIYLLSGNTFTNYAVIDEHSRLAEGESVFAFGNPGQWSDIYRRGYFAGTTSHSSFLSSGPLENLFDLRVWHGDSGAAIFSMDGEIVGVVSEEEIQSNPGEADQISMAVSLQLKFTPAQIERARTFGVPKDK